MCIQAEYHGFGVTIMPSKLTAMNGRLVEGAIQHVLNTPSLKVGSSARRVCLYTDSQNMACYKELLRNVGI